MLKIKNIGSKFHKLILLIMILNTTSISMLFSFNKKSEIYLQQPNPSSDTVWTISTTTLYGALSASCYEIDENNYFEWSIHTTYGPGLTFYIMNDTEFDYCWALSNTDRTPGNFTYTALLSDEETSASGIFYPEHADEWYFVIINHYVGVACQVEGTYSDFNDSITVNFPTAIDCWEENTDHYITWTSNGDFSHVNIDLYYDGSFLRNIVSNSLNNGSYLWNVPSDFSNFEDLYQINISNCDYSNTRGYSSAYFEIQEHKTISILAPSTSDTWEIGTIQEISWISTGIISNVKIELFNEDEQVLEIVGSTINNGSYFWTIPSTLENSTQYQVKISDTTNTLVNNLSNSYEMYVENSISLISPEFGDFWEMGSTNVISWNSMGSISNVKIELLKEDVLEMEITSDTLNNGSFSWLLPLNLAISTQYQIKITDVSNPLVYDISSYFGIYIVDTISIISPDGSMPYEMGNIQEISWSSTGLISTVNIDLFMDDELEYQITSGTPNNGSFSWIIPTNLENSTEYQIRIVDESNSLVYDFSASFEIIIYTTIDVTIPDSDISWEMGSTQEIFWISTGKIEHVKIELFKDGLLDCILDDYEINDGIYDWIIHSTLEPSTQYQIKITDQQNALVYDFSDYFTLYNSNSISINSPNITTLWEMGSTQKISWTSTGEFSFIRIDLFKNDILELTIDSYESNNGQYTWIIPTDLENSSKYQIKITDRSNNWTYDFSDYFEIIFNNSISLITPNNGSLWEINTLQNIVWQSSGWITNVKIELYNEDEFVVELISSTPNDGSYSLILPDHLNDSMRYKIKITDVSNPLVYDYSEYFEIYHPNSITVSSPNGDSSWIIGMFQSITWTSTGNILDVKIDLYSSDGLELEITPKTPNDGSFSWGIPSTFDNSKPYFIKITDVSNSEVEGNSDFFMLNLVNSISIVAPDSTNSWEMGTTQEIIWTSTGDITGVKIELFNEVGLEYEITTYTPNTGNYSWQIPLDLNASASYQIKINCIRRSLVYCYSEVFSLENSNKVPGFDFALILSISIISILGLYGKLAFLQHEKARRRRIEI
ncbi:Ser-Thr-rich GPI-anchored membrane family protein [Candidatus Lokiarchaeum ossiferum]|uniref:Ser-Thr-rich GPI-anchored membrane family protein n=1 Tax=Candidatus Lokiarchaeum ossiferum TaxID=2951803 RepID=UPI00352D0D49